MTTVGCDLIVDQLNFPSSVTFDEQGNTFISETGLEFSGKSCNGKVLQLSPSGELKTLIDGLRVPVIGVTHHQGILYISEGGNPGCISTFDLRKGTYKVILDDLPGGGDYHTNKVTVGPDNRLYFGQGAITNSGVVGFHNRNMPWHKNIRHNCDIPGYDIKVAAGSYSSLNPDDLQADVKTGAFLPFAETKEKDFTLNAALPCTSAVMSCQLDGSDLQLVAWGLRNPYSLTFTENGELLVLDIGMNDRGSRPLGNVPDCLFSIENGKWYGWPDFVSGRPVTSTEFTSLRPGSKPVSYLLKNHEELGEPQKALFEFPVHSAPTGFHYVENEQKLIVSMFGDKRPLTGVEGPKAGRKVASLDLNTMILTELPSPDFYRPISIELNPLTGTYYVVDFGYYEFSSKGLDARPTSGALWAL